MKTKLNILYYAHYVLYLALIVLFGYILNTSEFAIDPMTTAGQTIQYIAILYVLLSVPGSLYGFKHYMKKVSKIENEAEREKKYFIAAVIRICLIGLGAMLSIAAFYTLGQYTSMLWCAGIAVVAQYFCKPTERKIQIEMNDIAEDDPRMGEL